MTSAHTSVAMVTTNTFRFLDLPAEIRNLIYALLLVESEHVKLDTRSKTTDRLREWNMFRRQDTNISPGVLQVSRQLNAEATPILYGMNVFRFEFRSQNTSYLRRFLERIGTSRRHVRHISLSYFHSIQNLRSALHLLKEAKAIETFELGYYLPQRFDKEEMSHNKTVNPVKNMQAFLPWLKSLRKARTGGSKVEDVTNVFRLQEVLRADCYGDEAKYQEVCARMQKYFAKFIADQQQALN